jgi:hypothetical protein
MIEHRNSLLSSILKIWIENIVGIVLILSVFSTVSLLRLGGWISLGMAFLWTAWRLRQMEIERPDIKLLDHWPFFVLSSVCLVSLVAGPHDFLDSFSYRIPQILLWLQEGHPWSVPNVDMRINQMPHVWSFLGIPFFLSLREWGLAIPNWISYVLLYGILRNFAVKQGMSPNKAKWILCIFMASPVMVMQAASNDNVLTCTTLLALSLYFAVQQPRSTSWTAYSALAFALACGIKPQYVTLAPIWLVWFLWGKEAPVRSFRWCSLVWLVPVVVLCSPLPTFFVNQVFHGSISQPMVQEGSEYQGSTLVVSSKSEESGFEAELSHSFLSLGNQMMALPVNPLSGQLNHWMQTTGERIRILNRIGLYKQRVWPLVIPENASFGFFATIPLLVGLGLALRRRGCKGGWVAGGSLAAMVAAIFITTPGTLGRSFIGFFVLMLPFCFFGLDCFRLRVIRLWGVLCLLVGLLVIVINPACPLWPVSAVSNAVSNPKLKNAILDYGKYAKRHESGRTLVENIPSETTIIGAVTYDGNPIAELWKPFSHVRSVNFYSPEVNAEHLHDDGVSYIIVKHPNLLVDEELSPAFLAQVNGHIISKEFYVSYIQKGPEPWYLVRVDK